MTGGSLHGRDALEDARRTFGAAGLVLPVVPDELVDTLALRSKWNWSTWPESPSHYQAAAFHVAALDDVEARTRFAIPASDYVLFGHAGHGVNSYTLGYFLVRGPLALFVEVGWGGVYMNAEAATPSWNRAAALVTAIVRASAGLSQRLVVVANGFGESWWSRGGSSDRNAFERGEDVLADVLLHSPWRG